MYAGESAEPAHRRFIGQYPLGMNGAADFTVPVFRMLEDALAAGRAEGVNRWACAIGVKLLSGDAEGPKELVLPPAEVRIEIEGEADWTLCVDLGTSAIAVWCGPPGRVGRPLHQLPLGAWLENIDKAHDESSFVAVEADDAPAADRRRRNGAVSVLLPSNIGLASDFNLRDRFDVLSRGSLDSAGDTEEAVRKRLEARGRRYDISAPFPDWHRMNEYFGQIVFEPKRKLITCRPDVPIRVPGGVLCLDGDGIKRKDTVNLLHLLEDYFDEIATYLVPRVLDWAAVSPALFDAAAFGNALDCWLEGVRQPRLIITHPAGMSHEKRRLYRLATQSFAASLRGRRSGTPAEAVLIPEALAAARFGISRYRDQNGGVGLSDGEQLFVALDIGAGTYDVTVLTAVIKNGEPENWTIRSHFGLTVGGIELDCALTARVAEILRTASDDKNLQRTFEFFLSDPPSCIEDVVALARGDGEPARLIRLISMRFLRAVKTAKIRLTDALRRDCDAGRPYAWSDGDRAPVFSVKLSGRPAPSDKYDFPVRLRDAGTARAVYQIAGEPGAQLRIDAASDSAAKTVWLDLTRAALLGRNGTASGASELADYLKLLGDKLPRIARAAAKQAGSGTPAHWIVTGRTALWPDLYSAIADVARGVGGGIRGVISPQPYPANDMKIAVINGAQMLASEPHLDRGERVYNQLALVRTGLRGAGGRRITSIRYIPRSELPSSATFALGETDGPFQIARVVPCLDEREADGRTLLEHLEDIRNPPQLWWPVSHVRNPRQAYPGGGLQLRWETDGDGRTTITVEDQRGVLEVFGPYSEETVYGYD
jgi:hypothetical protein